MQHPRTQYVVERSSDFRVATAAYGDPSLFDAEMRNIFYTTWIYVAHESELARPGDYKSTWIGRQPVILVRDQTGAINCFANFCTHRGAALCREEYGNTRTFICPYHAWTFRTSGELVSVQERTRYPDDFDMGDKGLIRIPRVESYQGLIFACMKADVEPLDDYLGEAKKHIDYFVARCAGGVYRAGRSHKYAYRGNWKFQAENVIDGYHPGVVHRSAFNTIRKFSGSFENRALDGVRMVGNVRGYPQGHGTIEAGTPLESGTLGAASRRVYFDKLVQLYGEDYAKEALNNRHLLIFPSVAIMDFNIRVIQPIDAGRTEVYSYPMLIDGVDEDVNVARLSDVQTRLGTAGIVGADDIDIFNGSQSALQGVAPQWIVLSRGLGKEEITPTGERIGAFSDETPQRAFWRRWQDAMGTDQAMRLAAE